MTSIPFQESVATLRTRVQASSLEGRQRQSRWEARKLDPHSNSSWFCNLVFPCNLYPCNADSDPSWLYHIAFTLRSFFKRMPLFLQRQQQGILPFYNIREYRSRRAKDSILPNPREKESNFASALGYSTTLWKAPTVIRPPSAATGRHLYMLIDTRESHSLL